ncbi:MULTISPECIES: hypothetical protein [unclassified Nocardia]|uniref:hypothetical protein n=1 Tax=unclassified Nocardia TaxID=2637762 RepID=UPI0033A23A11
MRISGLRMVVAAAAVAMLGAGCATATPQGPQIVTTAPQSAPVFAVRTTTGMGVADASGMRGDRVGDYRDFGFSQDNSLAYTVDGAGVVTAMEVAELLVASGRIDCHCTRVFPLHDAVVGWWRDGAIMQADLRTPDPTVLRSISLPAPRDPLGDGAALTGTELIALDRDRAVLTRIETIPGAIWGINHLYVVDLNSGAVQQFGRIADVNMPFRQAAIAPGGRSVVVAGYSRDNVACGTASAHRLDLVTGTVDSVGPPFPSCSSIADIRGDGADVVLTRLVWDRDEPKRLVSSTVWRYRDGWTQVGADPAVRVLADPVAVELRHTGAANPFGTIDGDLIVDGKPVLRNVIEVRATHR